MIDKNQVVELNPYQVAAYWWVKRIKCTVDEVKTEDKIFSPSRIKFSEMFDIERIKISGYRKIYQELSIKIEERCRGHRKFSQKTSANYNGHAELNKWLSEIMGENVPNISIGAQSAPEVLISIIIDPKVSSDVYVGDVSPNGVQSRLPKRYKANAVLCDFPTKPPT